MNEIVRVDEWLYSLLHGDPELAGVPVAAYVAKQGTAYPRVQFNFQGGSDVVAVGAIRIMLTGLWQVKAIVQAESYASVIPLVDRIDALLHGKQGQVSDGVILGCKREQPIAYVEESDGLQYRHLGGLYRIEAQGAQ